MNQSHQHIIAENVSFEQIAAEISKRESFLVLGHYRPDGDAIGSQLALTHCLEHLGKKVSAWNQDAVPDKLAFLQGIEKITRPPSNRRDFDCVIALDTSDRVRLGTCLDAIGEAALWINIDHHPTNELYGDLNYVDPTAPATGEILYELIRSQDLPFTYGVADALYVAISTDTGSFQYPSTTARTYEVAADLIRAGVNVGEVSQALYQSYPLRRVELLRSLLNSLELHVDNKFAMVTLPLEEVRRIGSRPEDTEGLIDHVRSIDSVLVAALIEETNAGEIRASLRSKTPSVNVAKICQQLGGGGHALAAGVRLDPPLGRAASQIRSAVEVAIRNSEGVQVAAYRCKCEQR